MVIVSLCEEDSLFEILPTFMVQNIITLCSYLPTNRYSLTSFEIIARGTAYYTDRNKPIWSYVSFIGTSAVKVYGYHSLVPFSFPDFLKISHRLIFIWNLDEGSLPRIWSPPISS